MNIKLNKHQNLFTIREVGYLYLKTSSSSLTTVFFKKTCKLVVKRSSTSETAILFSLPSLRHLTLLRFFSALVGIKPNNYIKYLV